MRLSISKTFRFEASHVLPKHPGKCSRLHGHSWVLHVEVDGEVNQDTGFVVDFAELKGVVERAVIDQVDHQHLGECNLIGNAFLPSAVNYSAVFGPGFYPSSENLVAAFVRILRPYIQELSPTADLLSLVLEETCTSACRWQRKGEPRT